MIKKQILLISLIASSGAFASIDWVDEHEPCFLDHTNISSKEDVFDDHEDFILHETALEDEFDEEDLTYCADSDFEIEESTPEEFIAKGDDTPFESLIAEADFDLEESPAGEKEKKESPKDDIQFVFKETKGFIAKGREIAEADFDLEETPKSEKEKKESPKDDIQFVFRGYGNKDPIKEEMVYRAKGVAYKASIEPKEEIALLEKTDDEDHQVVVIGEVGPFSQFSINGQAVKLAIKSEADKVPVSNHEMIYFAPEGKCKEGFYISSKKVTNREYQKFVNATHHRPPPHWAIGTIPEGQEDQPVVNVTYKDAFLYSVWAGKRLPKETELMLAAKAGKELDIHPDIGEWTSTPSLGKNVSSRGAAHLTMNSELSRLTYHKVFQGDHEAESEIVDSNSYNNTTGFRVAGNASR